MKFIYLVHKNELKAYRITGENGDYITIDCGGRSITISKHNEKIYRDFNKACKAIHNFIR